ncbi:nitrile hydratase subunit beta [Catellatospora citrea]|uniref:Nitrile hydratase subunit beta n=1 Tax=Catellatospora citrea TaxID=53366 RepID=A0A8J3KJH0_9ACTN|nr:nitrile hydratase subunit beta [Catellatospora citrea]RKE05753.1 nitrile hydratase [Catellatospora citrea]GIF97114.1 nitrile hydratase subunit beta protein [Catellatospora citrea]
MDGIADMGGTPGWGPVHPPRADEPVFAEPWQGRATALAILAGRLAGRNLDAFRHAVERLDRAAYLDQGYFGRWLNAAELMLVEGGVLAPGEIDARARDLRDRPVEAPPEPARPDAPAPAWPAGPGSLRTIEAAPAFAVGQRVRTRNISPPGHTRLPRYARGHTGVVEVVQPAAVFPDTHAHFQGEHPQYVYSVRFDSHELWGEDADSFAVTAELFEDYLEAGS